MKATLNRHEIIKNLPTEEELLNLSTIEAIYVIRKLKALTESCSVGCVEVNKKSNTHGQKFSEKFQIWFNKNEIISTIK